MGRTNGIRKARRVAVMVLAATSTAIVAMAAGPVRAAIAPSAVATGTGVGVRPLDTGVSVAKASAGEDGATSKAVGVRALGHDIASTKSDGNDTKSDAVTRARVPLTGGSVEVAPRSTSAHADDTDARSTAHSDLVTAHLPNLVSLEVLSSDADAVWTPRRSSSRSRVDGAKVDLLEGDLVVVLMHAEGSSDGRGRLYLVRINNATFFDSDRSGRMTLSVPDIFTVQLGSADARAGRYTGEVLKVTWLDAEALDQFAAAVDASGGAVDPDTETFALSAAAVDAGDEAALDGRLPLSGAPVLTLVLAALTLIELGAGMTLLRTRARALA
jgi:hypothetical protein